MLFLLNDRMLDIGEPAATMRQLGEEAQARPSLAVAVRAAQEAAFASASFTQAHPDVTRLCAARIAHASEANCAIFLAPPHARRASEVAMQLASAPLTTMGFLYDAFLAGRLTPGLINAHVWSLAGNAGAA